MGPYEEYDGYDEVEESYSSDWDDYDSLGEEEESPTEESQAEAEQPLIPPGPVDEFFAELDTNASDPFRGIQGVSRRFGDKFRSLEAGEGGLYSPDKSADRLFSRMANRVMQSAPTINEREDRLGNLSLKRTVTGSSLGLSTGFIGRANESDYRSIISQPGNLQGTFFQFQQQGVLSALAERKGSFGIVTQSLSFSGTDREANKTTASILAGNEIAIRVGRAIQDRDGLSANPVSQIKSFASFHPKIGFVGDRESGGIAFLGTQNITPALKANNSLETLMSFTMTPGARNLNHDISEAAKTESAIATEVLEMTEAISGMISPGYIYQPGGIQKKLKERGSKRSFLYTESEIYGRVAKALRVAAFDDRSVSSRDRVVISMGEISMLLNINGYATDAVNSIRKLSLEKRLTILTDKRRIEEMLDDYRRDSTSSKSLRINKDLLQTLIQQGSIRTAATGYQHDKTIAVFGGRSRASTAGSVTNLKFFSTGSANFSADSMMPVGQIPNDTSEYFGSGVQALREAFSEDSYDTASPMNADTLLAIGKGGYEDRSTGGISAASYLDSISAKVASHYSAISGGSALRSLDNQGSSFSSGFISERNADEVGVERLKEAVEDLGRKIGAGAIEVKGRYDLGKLGGNGLAKLSGISITVKDVDGVSSKSVRLNLTVNKEGNVVISDSNRVITGSVFLNKSDQPMSVMGRTLSSGSSVNLSSLETAVGLVGTTVREMSYNARYSSIGDVFSNYAKKNSMEVQGLARDYLAEKVGQLIGEDVTLHSITRAIQDGSLGEIEADRILKEVSTSISDNTNGVFRDFSGSLTERERSIREGVISEVLGVVRDGGILGAQSSSIQAGELLSQILQKDNTRGILNDIKYEILKRSSKGYKKLAKAQSAQAGRLLNDLVSPFAAAHELGHGADQASHRKPVYSESTSTYGNSAFDLAVASGFLNPAKLGPSTKVGKPGEYIALVGASSHAKPLQTVGYGGIRQLTIIDNDISTGAAIRYSSEVFSSTPGLARESAYERRGSLSAVLRLMGKGDSLELMDEMMTDTLYFMPFNKAEQISQRLKNQIGGRPALDISREFVKALRRMDGSANTSQILNGSIRGSLSSDQFRRLKEVLDVYKGNKDKALEHFRNLELDPLSTQHGILGPNRLKRVAVMGGFSLMGDTSYLNADYEQDVGKISRMTVSFAASKVSSQVNVESLLARYMAKGNVVVSSPYKPGNAGEIEAIAEGLYQKGMTLSDVQLRLEAFEEGKYRNYILKQEGTSFRALLREGLYYQGKDTERLGGFSKDGLITVADAQVTTETYLGTVNQPLQIKFPAFGKRHESGVSVVYTTPYITEERGKINVTTDVMTTWEAGTGSRPVGMGLHKGPFEVIKGEVFDQLGNSFSRRSEGDLSGMYSSLRPSGLKYDKVYGLFSPGHFKGFNFETGLEMFKNTSSRKGLYNLDGLDIARSLSLLFMGEDSPIQSALIQSLGSEGNSLAQQALANTIGLKDYSSKGIGYVARGLASLARGEGSLKGAVEGDLGALRDTVQRALGGSQIDIDHLKSQSRKLIDSTLNDSSLVAKDNKGEIVSIDQNSPITRSIGMIAHTSFIMGQLTSIGLNQSVKGLYQLDIGDSDRYFRDVNYKNQIDAIAAQAQIPIPFYDGSNLEVIERRLSLLQAFNKNNVVLEDYKDTTISQNLVPTGMQDGVSLEYQYLLGISSKYAAAFEGAGSASERSKAIKMAFSTIAGSSRSIMGISPDAFIDYKLAFASEESGHFNRYDIEAQKMLLGYTKLADSTGYFDKGLLALSQGNAGVNSWLNHIYQVGKGVISKDSSDLNIRAIYANQLLGLSYFSEGTDELSIKQTSRLVSESGVSKKSALFRDSGRLSPRDMVVGLVTSDYQNFLTDREFRQKYQEQTISYQQYVAENEGPVSKLNAKYNILARNNGYETQTTFGSDRSQVRERVGLQISQLNSQTMSAITETYNTSVEDDFITGSLEAETRLQQLILDNPSKSEGYERLLDTIKTTKQVLMPALDSKANPDGSYEVRAIRPSDAEMSQGILLGTDITRHIALKFPGHVDQALQYQRSLREQLILTEDLRSRLYQNKGSLKVSAEQHTQLMQLEETVEGSRLSFLNLANTDVVRKAFGDKLSFSGAVGSAIGTFAIGSSEVGIGDRFHSVTSDSGAARTLSRQFESLYQLASSNEGPRSIDATRTLVEAIGLRGPSTLQEERASGIASKATVLEAFDKVHRQAKNGSLTYQDISEMENLTLSSLANTPKDQVIELKAKDRKRLHSLINTNIGALRRGGAPAGVSGPVNNNLINETVAVSEIASRIEREGGLLIPDQDRSRTAMFAPMIGRQLTMLGDFDGDAYSLVMNGLGNHTSTIENLQQQVMDISSSINELEGSRKSVITEGSIQDAFKVNELIEEQTGKLTVKQTELTSEIQKLKDRSLQYDKIEMDALKDQRQWVGSYLSLPDYVVNDSHISTGQLSTFVQQTSGMLGHVDDAGTYVKSAEERLGLIRSVFDRREGFQFTEGALENLTEADLLSMTDKAMSQGLEVDQRDSFRHDVKGIISQALSKKVNSYEGFISTSEDYLATQGNLAATFQAVNKSFGKASGTVINAMDFEGLQSSVGQAGTELIGKAYNMFIPLLDKAMGQHAMATVMTASGEGSFSNIMEGRLDAIASDMSFSEDRRRAALSIKQKISDDRVETTKRTERRVLGTSGVLGSLQQLIRDSLKEKSDKGMIGMLREASFDGKTMVEALEGVEGSTPEQRDRGRLNILQSVVQSKIGTDISGFYDSDPGITGFGALLEFASIATTKNSQIFDKFIGDRGLAEEYTQALNNPQSNIVSPLDFALDRSLRMLEQTQAAFKASTLSESSQNAFIESLDRRFNSVDYSPKDSYEAEQEGFFRDFESSSSIDPSQLIRNVMLSEVQRSNRENGVLTLDTMKELVTTYSESQSVRYGEGSIEERSQNMKIETHNAIIRSLQRGQTPDYRDSMYMKTSQIGMLSDALAESGLDPTRLKEQHIGEAASVINLALGDSPEERAVFTQALFMDDDLGQSGFNSLRESTAAMTYGVMGTFEDYYSESVKEKPNKRRLGVLDSALAELTKDGRAQVDAYRRLKAASSVSREAPTREKIDSDLESLTKRTFGSSPHDSQTRSNRTSTLLDPDAGLEAVGALAVPALMIAFGSGAKLDERVGLAALDTFQSIAYIGSDATRRTTEFLGDASSKANFRYTGARARDAMEQEGIAVGAMQSVVQESLFRGGSQMVYKAIDGLNNKMGFNKRKAGNAVGTILAETLSTVAVLGFSRRMAKKTTPTGYETPDRISDILKSFTDQVWKGVEAAQMALNKEPDVDVVSTSFNEAMDFDVEFSQFEQDLETGFIAISDEDDNILDSSFESSSATEAYLTSSFGDADSSGYYSTNV